MIVTRFCRIVFVFCSFLVLTSCAFFYPAKEPLLVHEFRAPSSASERTLLIMLPGRLSSADSFSAEGFVDLVRKTGLAIDVVTAEAHIGYYYSQTINDRIREDIIVPARANGYRSIWILGISMGGMGGIWYDRTHPDEIDGLILLAPYLGEESMVDEVESAGGLRGWQQEKDEMGSFPTDIWDMLKDYEDRLSSEGRLFLGFGEKDSFARADGMLAGILPQDQVATIPGDHDWPTWRALFASLLENSSLKSRLDPTFVR